MRKLQCFICVEAIIYMLSYNLHDCTFNSLQGWFATSLLPKYIETLKRVSAEDR